MSVASTSKSVFFFGDGEAEGDAEQDEELGAKGARLKDMSRLGLPVPSGFTISSTIGHALLARGTSMKDDSRLREEILAALARVERSSGARLGDPESPLLVSVRWSASASMRGAMDTILNVGMNDAAAKGIARKTGSRRFALDTYRRSIATYAAVVLGVKRELFDSAFEDARARVARATGADTTRMNGEELKRRVPDSAIPEEDLERLLVAFKAIVQSETGKDFPEGSEEQLWGAVDAVFRSWMSPRAIACRHAKSIPDAQGTACIVQAMVFGNLGNTSAAGAFFTRDPSTGDPKLSGEWLPNAQGEDLATGGGTPQPIRTGGSSLEEKMPSVFHALLATGAKLEKHFRDVQEIDFTVEDGRLFILESRAAKRTSRAAVRSAVDMTREGLLKNEEAVLRVDPSALEPLLHPTLDARFIGESEGDRATYRLLTRGLPASPGAAQGHLVFEADEAERRAGQGKPVILVRVETSPEDIHGMKAARGILTARGGMTSHAAVVARGMGKACVTGASAVSVSYEKQTMTITVSGPPSEGPRGETRTFKKGDILTIDGGSGRVYEGAVPTVPAGLSAEFKDLMSWADTARTLKVRTNADTPLDARTGRSFGAEGIGLCRTEHMFFEEDRIAAMREMILSDDSAQRKVALAKLLPAQRDDFVGIFREMKGLPVTIRLLDPPLHEFLPTDERQLGPLAKSMGVPQDKLRQRIKELHEYNPMLGHRGCRIAITFPEIYEMQVRAILEAKEVLAREGEDVHPEIMIPLAMTKSELQSIRAIVDRVALEVLGEAKEKRGFSFGTLIELPRAAIVAGDLAEVAEFFSFGTNDLTQATMGLSRDDAGKFLPAYVEAGILTKDPFVSLDQEGVGALVKLAIERGQATRPDLNLGVCGEHGGDPGSIDFFHEAGLSYVSCSPFRVAIARLAAAQSALRSRVAREKRKEDS
jgi:pyruvate,orthophosphate dikinase